LSLPFGSPVSNLVDSNFERIVYSIFPFKPENWSLRPLLASHIPPRQSIQTRIGLHHKQRLPLRRSNAAPPNTASTSQNSLHRRPKREATILHPSCPLLQVSRPFLFANNPSKLISQRHPPAPRILQRSPQIAVIRYQFLGSKYPGRRKCCKGSSEDCSGVRGCERSTTF